LTGLAAALNSVRFNQVPSNSGLGLELKVIAAVAVGGAAITGGSASITGTVLGVILLSGIGSALTFLGINAYWEKAIQGAIILIAVAVDALQFYRRDDAHTLAA
jgi:rhamnose transport system permease protein